MSTDRNEPGRDEHLRAALRHAPDHDAAPPPALSAQIRRQAHAAVQPPWWTQLFTSLTRPAVAGGLATVMMATVIGLMWRDGPPPDSAPLASAPPSAAPTALADASAERAAPPTAPPPEQAAAPSAMKPEAVKKEVRPQEPKVARSAAPKDAESEAAPARQSSPPATAPMPAPAAAPAARRNDEAMKARTEAPASESMASGARIVQEAPARGRLAVVDVDPLAPALASLAAVPVASDNPAGIERRNLLKRWQSTLRGRWSATVPLAAGEGQVVEDDSGRPLGRLKVDADAVIWQDNDGRAWRATRP